MEKSGFSKYIVIAFIILILFYVGSLNKKITTLEKNVATLKNGTTTTKPGTTTADGQPQQTTIGLEQVRETFSSALIKFGDSNGKVVALEITDPSCPYCAIAAGKNKDLNNQSAQFKLVEDGGTYQAPIPALRKLAEEGKIAFAVLYTPGHGAGELGMKALYCAFDQGKYWEAHDLIMNNSGYSLLNEDVKNDMTKSGVMADFLASVVDRNALQTCLDSGKYDEQLDKDTALARSLGVTGTPGFYINETKFAGAYGFDKMEPVITAALGQ